MEKQPGAIPKALSRTKEFIAHPVTGFSIGIIGIILAIYFYFAGITKPDLIFLIHPIRTPIVSAGKLSEISVLLRGKPINGDLTAAQFAIWNSGKAPIRHEDILKPIVLLTSSNCPIYEATIRNVSRDVVGFQLGTNDMASGRLSFDWKILEHNDGASIQILYGGDQKMRFAESAGVVVGQNYIPFQVLNVSETTLGSAIFGVVFLLLLALFFAAGTKTYVTDFIKAIHDRKLKLVLGNGFGAICCATITIMVCIGAFRVFMDKNAPPFAF